MTTELTTYAPGELTIEKLAAALEQAVRVDEIKEVRDRAMAIQLYSRKKAGGLAAAMAAGRIVTEATLKLAKLYAEEKSAQAGRPPKIVTDGSELPSGGKKAVAEAAGIAAPNLHRLRPLVDAPKETVAAAMNDIERRGDVVTPNALLREVTGEPTKPTTRDRVVIVINGRRLPPPEVEAIAVAVAARVGEDARLDKVHRALGGVVR